MLPVLFTNGALSPRPEARPANRLSALCDDIFGPTTPASRSAMPLWVWEDTDAVHVEMDLPGVTTEDIELSVHDGTLTIRGERKCEERKALYDGRCCGRFVQRVELPAAVEAGAVEATLANGVLKVTLPKSADSKPRKIAVRAG